jgi:hypothetical protein
MMRACHKPHSKKIRWISQVRFPKTVTRLCAAGFMWWILAGCGGEDGQFSLDPDGFNPVLAGVTVSLAWDPPADPSVTGYYVYYGTNSSGEWGSCNYEHALFVSSNEATVVNLAPETRYYFAVSSFNGLQSACSSEVSTVTSPLPT